MKDSAVFNLNGKQIKGRLDLGAMEDFCEDLGIDFAGFDKALASPKGLRTLLYHCIKAEGNEDVSKDDLKRISFAEISKMTELLETAKSGNEKAAKG